jgi:hypothetical protein
MINPQTFTGLIPLPPRPLDYVAGVNSPLAGAKVMISGDWTPFDAGSEGQSIPGVFETFDCTGFALTRLLEAWLKYYIYTGDISPTKTPQHWDFLTRTGVLDSNNNPRLSPRFIGAVAGTNQQGNSLQVVLDAVRKYGVCSNQTWPWDRNTETTITTYYVAPSAQAYAEAAEWNNLFQINYEFFFNDPGNYKEALQECPLYVALATCPGWMTDKPVNFCGVTSTNHCVDLIKDDLNNPQLIFDSYPEFVKELAVDYTIPFALKVFLTIKQNFDMVKKYIINDHGKLGIMISEGFSATVLYADSPDHLQKLKDANNFTGAEPTVNLP